MGLGDWLKSVWYGTPMTSSTSNQDSSPGLIDCRELSLSMTSWTQNPEIAEIFFARQKADGSDLVGKLPNGAREFMCDLTYPIKTKPPQGPLFKAAQMEDKFNVYHYDGVFYFERSWTGELYFAVKAVWSENLLRFTTAYLEEKRGDDELFARRVIDFLFKSHCLNMVVPHPVWPSLRKSDKKEIQLWSFSIFGRRAWHGSFDETIDLASDERYDFR